MKKKKVIEKKENSSKYLIPGSIFIFLIFVLIIRILSKTYAIDGFGEVSITCDKNIITSNTITTCEIKGTVATANNISSLEIQTNLSSNIEFVSFTKDSSWEGEGDNNKIELYTDTNKTGTFNIGTIQVKAKNDSYNTKESIKLNNIVFYKDAANNFAGENISEKTIELKTPTFTSTKYDLTKDYIISDSKDIATIISNITTTDCDVKVSVDNNLSTTGTIKEGSKLTVKNNNTLLKEYDIVYIESSSYNITNETKYIITIANDISNVLNYFTVINGTISIKNKNLTLSYKNTDIRTIDIIQLASTKIKVNVANNYVVANTEEEVINNITKSDNITLSISNNNLLVTYNGNVIRTLKIYTISSSNYNINIEDKYIYTKSGITNSDLLNNILTNGTISLSSDKVLLKDTNNTTMVTFNLINITSNNYEIDYTNKTIYTGYITDSNTIKTNTNVTNSEKTITNNKLVISYNQKTIDEYTICNISSTEYDINNKIISIDSETDYQAFVNNLSLNNLTYKIINDSNTEISSGTIKDNYKLKILMNNNEVDTFTIKLEYLDISDKLSVKEDKKIIHRIKDKSSFTELINNISTNARISIKDINNNELEISEKIKTGDIITIHLNSGNISYKASVLGDTTGDGEIKINDVGRLYQYLRNKTTMDEEYVLAGDTTGDGEIKINDVGRLYSKLRGRIESFD